MMWWKPLLGVAIIATPMIVFFCLTREKRVPKSENNNHDRGFDAERGPGDGMES